MDVAQFTPAGARLSRYFQWKSRESAEPQGLYVHHNTHFVSPDDTGFPGGLLVCISFVRCNETARSNVTNMAVARGHIWLCGRIYIHTQRKEKGDIDESPPLT